jgi:hypothetical protein
MSAEECLDSTPAKLFIEQAEFAVAGRAHPVQQRHIPFEVS